MRVTALLEISSATRKDWMRPTVTVASTRLLMTEGMSARGNRRSVKMAIAEKRREASGGAPLMAV